jgi:hypothetical protein
MNGAILLLVSMLFIGLELFFTRMLNLKTWNHVVYVIIPFAMLGYGIGANAFLIARPRLAALDERKVLHAALLVAGLASIASAFCLIQLPVQLNYIDTVFRQLVSAPMLLVAYSLLIVPFAAIGFVVVLLFQSNPAQAARLYFLDLLGAGIGALAFFLLIGRLQVIHSIVLLVLLAVLPVLALAPARRALNFAALVGVTSLLVLVPEPLEYVIDPAKGWEYVPDYFAPSQYEHSVSRWHPMGRTDVFRILDRDVIENVLMGSGSLVSRTDDAAVAHVTSGTFEINLIPPPELAYLATNFVAGTPIFNLSPQGIRSRGSRLIPFSQPMEAPYVLLHNPRVVILGAGGGRDIFMARSHGAKSVVGAEINPATYSIMSPGGEFYDYSGGVYAAEGVEVFNVDGRHLVKTLAPSQYDFVILNGVDTYSGLSTGAYSYAESYLYTKNAIRDYLGLLRDEGILDFNRFFDADLPRENLRLFVNVMEAMRELGIAEPWNHVVIGDDRSWGMTLIKKTPFTPFERQRLRDYFERHHTQWIYPLEGAAADALGAKQQFALYAESLKAGRAQEFLDAYPFDISVVTDDKPFFYKQYKFSSFDPFESGEDLDVGPVMLMTQLIILVQASLFIALFILLPLRVFQRQGSERLPAKLQRSFIVYFSGLGLGFMLIEIPVMQRFTLLLGSPIHSISVTLVALLVSTGVGSLLLPWLRRRFASARRLVVAATAALVAYLAALALAGGAFEPFMGASFLARAVIVALAVFPLGLVLGVYFPLGLERVASRYEATVPWAWGINSGFSVLGGIVSILLAQAIGFSAILILAALVYVVAARALLRMLELLGAPHAPNA